KLPDYSITKFSLPCQSFAATFRLNRLPLRAVCAIRRISAMPGVEDKVKQIIVDQLSVEESEVTPAASFVDDLGADSLDRVELIMAFEEAFDIEIPDEEAEKIKTVQDAVSYIEKNSKIAKQNSTNQT